MTWRSGGWLRVGALALVAGVWASASVSAAPDEGAATSSYRAVIDRVDLEPAAIGGDRLRVYFNALTLDGASLDLSDPKMIRLMTGNTELKVPYVIGRYGATTADTAIVVVVETAGDYSEVLPAISDNLDHVLFEDLNDAHTQVAVLTYGDSVGNGKLGTVKAARGKLGALSSDGSAGDPALLDTLDRALLLLKKAKTVPEGRPLRKMIVVIGDGRDRAGDRDRVTRLGKRAAKEGVRIDAIGHSPTDTRRPLLLLGELAKQSLGTFRWVRSPATPDSWAAQFKHLHEELAQQYVLTYFVPTADEVAGKKLHVVTVGRTESSSNEAKVPAATCGGDPCDGYCAGDHCVIPQAPTERGIVGWMVMLIGIGVGAIVVLGTIGFVMSKRRKPIPLPPGVVMPGKPMPGKPMPGMSGTMAGKPGVAAVPGAPVAPAAPAHQQIQGVASGVPRAAPVAAAAPAAAPVAAGPRASATAPVLYFMTGPRTGQTIAIRHGFTIGKAPTSDLVIDDGYTSSQHAQLGMDHHGNCVLYDRGSTNGTFVNGVRITEYALSHGVSMRIGSTELRFLSQ